MPSMNRMIFTVISILVPCFLLLFNSGVEGDEGKRNQRPIYIAIVVPLSDSLAEFGRSMVRGGRMRADEDANQSHPHGSPVKLLTLDDRGEATDAVRLAEHIKYHPSIVAVIGHLTTGCTLSAIPAYSVAGLPLISPVATGGDLDTVKSPYVFRTILSETQQVISLARYIYKTMGKITVALLYEDSPLGNQLKKSFLLKSKEIGLPVKPIVIESNPFPNINEAIHEIAMLKAGAIISASGAQLTSLVVRKWPENIDKPLIFGTYRLVSEEFMQLVGNQSKGIMAAHPCIWDSSFHKGREIRDRYEKKWKYNMDWIAGQTYDAVDLVLWAIRKSRSQPDSVRDALKSLNAIDRSLPGLAGPIYFNRNGSLAREVTVAVYTGRGWKLKKN
jgi:ABC-type branched-subunit amino acid transport system substrate-binding protein